jgi:hypothetical protein
MTTDELIAALSRSPEPVSSNRLNSRIGLALIVGLVVAVVLLKLTLGFRPDIGVSAPIVALKALFSALIATFAGGLALKLAKPVLSHDGGVQRMGSAFVTLLFACLAIGAITIFATKPSDRFVAFTGGGFPWCIFIIPVLGLPSAALMMWALREGAPTRLALAGACVGALSGGIGAVAYAMACPVDSVAFVTFWYVIGIAISSALGAVLGARLLRW